MPDSDEIRVVAKSKRANQIHDEMTSCAQHPRNSLSLTNTLVHSHTSVRSMVGERDRCENCARQWQRQTAKQMKENAFRSVGPFGCCQLDVGARRACAIHLNRSDEFTFANIWHRYTSPCWHCMFCRWELSLNNFLVYRLFGFSLFSVHTNCHSPSSAFSLTHFLSFILPYRSQTFSCAFCLHSTYRIIFFISVYLTPAKCALVRSCERNIFIFSLLLLAARHHIQYTFACALWEIDRRSRHRCTL